MDITEQRLAFQAAVNAQAGAAKLALDLFNCDPAGAGCQFVSAILSKALTYQWKVADALEGDHDVLFEVAPYTTGRPVATVSPDTVCDDDGIREDLVSIVRDARDAIFGLGELATEEAWSAYIELVEEIRTDNDSYWEFDMSGIFD